MLKVVIKDRCVLKKRLYIYLSIYIIGHHHVKSSFGANKMTTQPTSRDCLYCSFLNLQADQFQCNDGTCISLEQRQESLKYIIRNYFKQNPECGIHIHITQKFEKKRREESLWVAFLSNGQRDDFMKIYKSRKGRSISIPPFARVSITF